MRQPLKFFICSSCDYRTDSKTGADKCPNCGSQLIKECPRCKKVISDAGQSHCPHCEYEYRGRHS